MHERTRFGVVVLMACSVVSSSPAQTPEEQVRRLIEQVSLDSLVHHVRALSGADSVDIPYRDNEPFVITTRRAATVGHELAAYYLKANWSFFAESFHHPLFREGEPVPPHVLVSNLYQPLNAHEMPPHLILCAHYDSWSREGRAPGADDNASGVAVVMEAARILSDVVKKYPVVYVLFDWEEQGAVGSHWYSYVAEQIGEEILGVINLDMLGYDANNDRDFWIAGDTAHRAFTEAILSLNERYNIGLGKGEIAWAKRGSDHHAFWKNGGYPAVAVTEGWWSETDDVNEYHHTDADTIGHFNLDTYYRMAKLAVAAVAHFALGVDEIVVGTHQYAGLPDAITLSENYPNPFSSSTTISYDISETADVTLVVYDVLGRQVRELVSGTKPAGTYEVSFDATGLPTGVYVYRLQAGDHVETRRMVVVR